MVTEDKPDPEVDQGRPQDLDEFVHMEQLAMLHRLDHLEAVVAQLQNDFTVLDERQAEQLAHAIDDRRDVSDERHIAQLGVAEHYASFVDQNLYSLARENLIFYTSRAPRREWIARMIGSMCARLFRTAPSESLGALSLRPGATDRLVERHNAVVSEARTLHELASQTGLRYHWDFYFVRGRRLDNQWQEPWASCDPSHATKFLVAPAYVVDGHVYQRQRVYTSENAR